jgi:hypothetical protein
MRIYLDTCVFQDLKKKTNTNLLDAILKSKGMCIYYFSEAHIMDLSRDKTDEKFTDMVFMETIVDNNCFGYEKKIVAPFHTPSDYYNRFDWTTSSANETIKNLEGQDNVFGGLLKFLLSSIPVNFKDLIPPDQLPHDIPRDMIDMLLKPSNMYEFMLSMTDYSDTLSTEQKKFKEQLQYLHQNQLLQNLALIGIEGFDGNKITDREKFRDSYANYFLKDTKGKYRYDLFMEMYNGLEFLSLVQGKPRKQKMTNMINDGRHAFFGGFCDIVVSKDEDFINKTKFMYDILELQTRVYSITEFANFIENQNDPTQSNFMHLVGVLSNEDTMSNVTSKTEEEKQNVIYTQLNNVYLGYFDTLIIHPNGNVYFTQETKNLMAGSLIKEIQFCVNQLFSELGTDIYSRESWIENELKKGEEKQWHGRTWIVNNLVIELKFWDKLYIILSMIDQ